MSIKDELIEERDKRQLSYFWGTTIGIFSLLHAIFLLVQPEYISESLDVYLLGVNQILIGSLLLILAIVKLLGIFVDNQNMRIIGIVGLAGVWGMLFTVATLWSFGIGYPSNIFLSNGLMLVASIRVAYRGVIDD